MYNMMDLFKSKFSQEMVTMLMGMQDFNLYELSTNYGEATFGFGEAYNIGTEITGMDKKQLQALAAEHH